MGANQTVNTYGTTYFPPLERNSAELQKVTYGLNFPIGKNRDSGGFFKKVVGRDLIRGAVKQLLSTERGERIMLPRFGCNLRRFLFQPLTESTFEAIKREIAWSFDRYIVGATIQRISVIPYGDAGPAGGNSLKVSLVIKISEGDLTMFDVEVVIT